MPTKQQLEQALIGADRAGDVEAARTLARALKSGQYYDGSAPGVEQQRADIGGLELRPFGIGTGITMPQGVSEALAGMGRRMTEIGTLGNNQPQPAADGLLDDSGYAMAGGIAADIGAMSIGGGLLKGASAVPKIGKALQVAGNAISTPRTALQAVTGAAGYGAATSNDRADAALAGGVGGLLGYGIPKAVGSVVKPALQKGAQALKDSGATLTPGELLGGWVQRIEDGATSIPFAGDFIKNAKKMSIQSFNRSLVDDALKQVGGKLDDAIPTGREAIAFADNALSTKYDDVLSSMNVQADPQLAADIASLRGMIQQLPSKERSYIARNFDEQYDKAFNNPTQTALGKTFKELVSSLRGKEGTLKGSSDAYQKEAGQAIAEIRKSLMEAAKRQNPDLGEELAKTDRAYAMISRIKEASAEAGAQDGIFTPAMLLRKIKKQAGTNRFAKGEGFGQDFVEGAKGVLPATVPDSGTPLRAMVGGGLLAGAGGASFVNPAAIPALAGLIGTAGLYTQPSQKLLQTLIASRPAGAAGVRRGIDAAAPYLGLLGAGVNLNQ